MRLRFVPTKTIDTSNIIKTDSVRHQQSKILTGAFVVIFGILYLLKTADVNIPHWGKTPSQKEDDELLREIVTWEHFHSDS